MPPDAAARLAAEAQQGFLVVSPQRAFAVENAARLAWWRIISRSGETTAVTDEGLHQATTEYATIHNTEEGTVEVN